VLFSIPSPSSGILKIGPLSLHAYGVMIALGVVAAVWLTGRRFVERGIGTPEDAGSVGMWGVLGGIIGARLYHVITQPEEFSGRWFDAVKIWKGGLGIWGGIALGVVAGMYAARRRGIPVMTALHCAVPALPLAQAIGRWGNWWNQELYGRTTSLPWALEITAEPGVTTLHHPTFLYESLWNIGLCVFLLWLDRNKTMRHGRLFAWYVAGYTFARFFIENIRIDEANKIAGLRVNVWVSMLLFAISVVYLLATRGRATELMPAAAVVESEPDVDHSSVESEVVEAAGGSGERDDRSFDDPL
jgi:prolipoprotein diacylglyceryl transferase